MASTTLENIKRATQATIDALNAWDLDALVAVRTNDFVFQGQPGSLQMPPMNNAEYEGMWLNMMTPAFKNFKIEPKWTAHDAENRRSTVWNQVSATTPVGYREWELVQMMSFNESGDKLTRLDEFFDSHTFLEMNSNMQNQGDHKSDESR